MKRMVILLLLFVSLTTGQNKLTHKYLIQDFDKLSKTIELTHPDPYTPFGGKMSFHRKVLEYKKSIPEDGLNKREFYFIASKFVSHLQDGHTFIRYPANVKQDRKFILPVKFKITSDGLVVKSALSGYTGFIGYRLTEVNGININSLLKRVRQFDPCENISGAYFAAKKYLSELELARQLFPELEKSIVLTLKSKDNSVKKLNLSFASIEKEKEFLYRDNKKQITKKEMPFSYRFIDNEKKIACLKFTSTYSREVIEFMKVWKQDYSAMIRLLYSKFQLPDEGNSSDESITKIPSFIIVFNELLLEMKKNNSTHLVIDLRENEGGWAPITLPTLYMLFGDDYLNYESDAEYNTLISELYLKKQNTTLENFNKYRNTSLKLGDYNFGRFLANNFPETNDIIEKRRKYIESIDFLEGVSSLNEQNGKAVYKPEIVIAVSPATFSAAFQYLYFLKEVGNAKIVGVSPRQAYNASMESTNFILANSKLSCSVSNSYQLFKPEDLKNGKILIPDYELSAEIFEKYNCHPEAEIFYIKDLIQNKKIK